LRTGTVQRYSDLEGYGYIRPDDGGKELMVQRVHVVGVEALSEGQRVTYKVSSTKRRQAIASSVRILDDSSSAS
jgi:cold shock protein